MASVKYWLNFNGMCLLIAMKERENENEGSRKKDQKARARE